MNELQSRVAGVRRTSRIVHPKNVSFGTPPSKVESDRTNAAAHVNNAGVRFEIWYNMTGFVCYSSHIEELIVLAKVWYMSVGRHSCCFVGIWMSTHTSYSYVGRARPRHDAMTRIQLSLKLTHGFRHQKVSIPLFLK